MNIKCKVSNKNQALRLSKLLAQMNFYTYNYKKGSNLFFISHFSNGGFVYPININLDWVSKLRNVSFKTMIIELKNLIKKRCYSHE